MSGGDLSDWKKWRTKLFANVPLSKRGQGEFLFTSSTVESYLLTMQDSVGRPIFREATELTVNDSNVAGKFFGREVTLVEPDVIADAGTASPGDVIGIYWVPSDYCINSQMRFSMKRYFDEDKNEWVNKLIVIADGKILDPAGCWLIKKGS
jgi:HK97 family phage major capsid protein